MKTIRLLATNTIAQMLGKVATVGSTVLIGRMISSPDGLGKSGFDEYAIIVAYAAYFYIITDFGFNAIAAKDITEDESKSSSYISNLLTLRLVLALALIMVGLAVLLFIPSYPASVKFGIILMLVTIVSQAIFTNGNILFQARLRYFQSTIAVIAGSTTSLASAFIVYSISGNLYGYLLAIILGSVVMAIISLVQVGAAVPVRLKFDWPVWRHVALAALPLGATIVFNLLYIRSGFFILSIHDAGHYGIYTMAYRVFDAVLVLPVFMVNALYPIMIQRLQLGRAEFKRLFVRALLGMVGLAILVTVGVWVLAPVAIWLSTDNQLFNEAIQALRWLSLLVPLFFISNVLLWTLIALERRRLLIVFYGVGAIVSLGLNLWLIPQYGYVSAIAITGVVEGLITLLMGIQVWTLLHNDKEPTKLEEDQLSEVEANVLRDEEVLLHE